MHHICFMWENGHIRSPLTFGHVQNSEATLGNSNCCVGSHEHSHNIAQCNSAARISKVARWFASLYSRHSHLCIQGHFGVIQCTCNFSENMIFKMLLLHLGFFYSQTFCRFSLYQSTQKLKLKRYWKLKTVQRSHKDHALGIKKHTCMCKFTSATAGIRQSAKILGPLVEKLMKTSYYSEHCFEKFLVL